MAMSLRDAEKVARALHAQHLDLAYIRHYLMETYQLDAAQIDGVLKRIGLVSSGLQPGMKPPGPERRSKFY